MLHKPPAMTLTRPWPHGGSFKSHWREIVVRLKNMAQIPTGYEDETGFHLGAEQARTEIQWPPA
jgi:hypothetical protein